MTRLRNSWELAKTSWGVIRDDKELLWIPVLSFVTWVLVAALIAVPIFLTGSTTDAGGQEQFDFGPLGWVLAFVGYVALAYVTIFFRAAILCGADDRLQGRDPTLGSALRGAANHAARLLPWAIVSATVSLILQAIEERAGIVGRIVVGLIGLAWTLVTFLVLPVLIVEHRGVFPAIKRSAELFKRTWGENVIAQFGLGLVGFLAALPGIGVGALLAVTGAGPLVVTGIGIGVVWLALVSVVMSALGAVYQMALYRFAVDGSAPEAFAAADLEHAFRPRKGRVGL
jgi:hypothetical protein